LRVYGIEKNDLREFTTTERDKKRGTSRFPPDSFRIREGELIREVDNSSEKA
jgi:hypothetical protein